MKNKRYFLDELKEKTGYTEEQCNTIQEVLDNHFIIGRNNKKKIVSDFIEKLNLTEEEADNLYNICSESIVTGVFK